MNQGFLGKARPAENPVVVERRKHPRHKLFGIEATLNNHVACTVENIAAEGVLLSGIPMKDSPGIGQSCTAALRVTVGSRMVPVLVRGRVVREGRGHIAVHYTQPAQVWPRLLELLAERENEHAAARPIQTEIETLLSGLAN